MAGPARKAGVMTSKSPSIGPKSVASKPGPVVPKRAAAPTAPKPAVKAAMRTQRMPAAPAVQNAAPQARFQRSAGMDARISIPKGETITPISPAGSYRPPKAPMQPAPSTGNAHGYMSDMAAQAKGSPARPGYTRPVQPKT